MIVCRYKWTANFDPSGYGYNWTVFKVDDSVWTEVYDWCKISLPKSAWALSNGNEKSLFYIQGEALTNWFIMRWS